MNEIPLAFPLVALALIWIIIPFSKIAVFLKENYGKKLSMEEILELGWNYEGLTKDGKLEIYGGLQSYTFYRFKCPDGYSAITIFKALPSKGEGSLFSGISNTEEYTLKIKNKSELSKIMKQIGIKH